MLSAVRAFIMSRQTAYRRTFAGPPGEAVLGDLINFCRGVESTYHIDQRVTDMLNGRREVLLRIQQHLNLSPNDLFELSTGQPAQPRVQRGVSDDE